MNLTLRYISNSGDIEKERISLKVSEASDIGDYVFTQNAYASDTATGLRIIHAFWFPYGAVEVGDLIVLYTKKGKSSQKKLEAGNTAHFFYWGLEKAIWGGSMKSNAVIMHAPKWTSKLASELEI